MRYIDETIIYQETDGGKDIFRHYYSNYDFGKHPAMKLKVRTDEKSASAIITNYKGIWRITDFGNQTEVNGLKGISFVRYMENLSYQEALMYTEDVIIRRKVGSSEWSKPSFKAGYDMREMGQNDKTGEYNFAYKSDGEITKKDVEAFGRYVTKEMLAEFNCKVLKHYELCSFSKKLNRDVVHKFIATDDYPMFVFDYGDFKKLYKPHEMDKKFRFMYVGTKPKSYIYGLEQLKKCDNEFIGEDEKKDTTPADKPNAQVWDIFRCSGESDALNLHSLGFHVYWLNSETAELTYDEYSQIDDLCARHYQIMDLDPTGQKMALVNALKYIDIFTLELPGYLSAKKDFRGNPCKDLKDFINLIGNDAESTRKQFLYRKAKARKVKFWEKSTKEKRVEYNLNMEYFFYFLKANGFFQMEYRRMKNTTDYCYVWIQDKMVNMIPPDSVKRIVKKFTKDWIKGKNFTDEIALLNKLNSSNQITEATIDTIDSVNINFKNASRDFEYIHFKNASIRISKDSIERIKHEDVPNYILSGITVKGDIVSHLTDKNISLIQQQPITVTATPAYQTLLDKQSVAGSNAERESVVSEIALLPEMDRYDVTYREGFIFTDFIRDITRIHWRKEIEDKQDLTETEKKEEMLALVNMMFCLGYLAAQHKSQGKPWVVFLQDTKISEIGQASGRSGKSLVSKSLKHVRQCHYIDGKTLDSKSSNPFQFIYDGLTEFHDVIEIDDFAQKADFSFFYNQITGNRIVNSKNVSPFMLEYEDSGKMIISTNFELPSSDSSTSARILNCGTSDYYHEKTSSNDYKETRSPMLKFGKNLFSDFTDEEWTQFYNFYAYCIQLQMRFDKISPPMENIERRQLRREMSNGLGREEYFLKWADDHFQPWDTVDGIRPTTTPKESDFTYLDTLFVRATAYNNFCENSGMSENMKKSYNAQRFKTHLSAWAKYHGFILNPEQKCNNGGRIISKRQGKVVELFYICTTPTNTADLEVTPTISTPTDDMPF